MGRDDRRIRDLRPARRGPHRGGGLTAELVRSRARRAGRPRHPPELHRRWLRRRTYGGLSHELARDDDRVLHALRPLGHPPRRRSRRPRCLRGLRHPFARGCPSRPERPQRRFVRQRALVRRDPRIPCRDLRRMAGRRACAVALGLRDRAPGHPTTGAGASGGPGGTAAAAAKYGGTITFGLENDVSNLDPMLSGLFVDRNIHYMMYDSLVRVNTKGDIIPWLAEKWTTSSDGKTITFNLRQGVKYHDGTAFDAASVKWNIERYKNTKGSSRTGDLGAVATVDVVDTYTVKFNLSAAFAPLLAALVDRAGMMVSQKVADAMGADFTLKPFKAGTGPFILTEAVKTDHYTLERNPDWWGTDDKGNKLPFLDKIIVKPILDSDVRLTNLRTGQVQVLNGIAGKDVPALKADTSLTYQEVGSFAWSSMIPNEAQGFIFNEKRYVKAVAMAIDRQEILDKGPTQGNLGLVGYGPIAPAHFAYDPNFKPWPKADPEGAKKLIAEVGKPLKFELLELERLTDLGDEL